MTSKRATTAKRVTSSRTLAAGLAVSAVVLTLGVAGGAHADSNPGSTGTLAAVGSDTTQDVMDALAAIVKDDNGNPLISNYAATPVGRTIVTRADNAACRFTAPRNSTEGRDALSAALRRAPFTSGASSLPVTSPDLAGCVDIARSSSGGDPSVSPGQGKLTYLPFATDSVTYTTRTISTLPHKLNINTLRLLYTRNGKPGSTACLGAAPLLPASGSGTRAFFATMLGLTDAPIGKAGAWGTCVADQDAAGTPIQEYDGRFLTAADQLLPYVTAQYLMQQSGVVPDVRGSATLGAIDFGAAGTTNAVSPVKLQANFGTGARSLYNVVATDSLTEPKVTVALVGPASKVCLAVSTIEKYGLAVNPSCGSAQKTNGN